MHWRSIEWVPISSNTRSNTALWQTLTTLNLSGTDSDGIGIGDEGAKHLANALKINRVSHDLYSRFDLCAQSQSLTTLEIHSNGIGSEGAQALAIARITNEVSQCLYSFTNMSFFITDMQSSGKIGFLDLFINKVWSDQESVGTRESAVNRRERRSPPGNFLHVLDSLTCFTVRNVAWTTRNPLIYAFTYLSCPTQEPFSKGLTGRFLVFFNPSKVRYLQIFQCFTFGHLFSSSWDRCTVSMRSIYSFQRLKFVNTRE